MVNAIERAQRTNIEPMLAAFEKAYWEDTESMISVIEKAQRMNLEPLLHSLEVFEELGRAPPSISEPEPSESVSVKTTANRYWSGPQSPVGEPSFVARS
jgi:hypothetical protein